MYTARAIQCHSQVYTRKCHYLALIVDIGSCLQQYLDYLGVSIVSSYLQRNIAPLYENIRDKRTVITSGDHCCRTERERETRERDQSQLV